MLRYPNVKSSFLSGESCPLTGIVGSIREALVQTLLIPELVKRVSQYLRIRRVTNRFQDLWVEGEV